MDISKLSRHTKQAKQLIATALDLKKLEFEKTKRVTLNENDPLQTIKNILPGKTINEKEIKAELVIRNICGEKGAAKKLSNSMLTKSKKADSFKKLAEELEKIKYDEPLDEMTQSKIAETPENNEADLFKRLQGLETLLKTYINGKKRGALKGNGKDAREIDWLKLLCALLVLVAINQLKENETLQVSSASSSGTETPQVSSAASSSSKIPERISSSSKFTTKSVNEEEAERKRQEEAEKEEARKKAEEAERLRKEAEEEAKKKERLRKEEEERLRKEEEERLRKKEEERLRKEEEARKKAEEAKKKAEEKARKEEEDKKKAEEERLRKEAEERNKASNIITSAQYLAQPKELSDTEELINDNIEKIKKLSMHFNQTFHCHFNEEELNTETFMQYLLKPGLERGEIIYYLHKTIGYYYKSSDQAERDETKLSTLIDNFIKCMRGSNSGYTITIAKFIVAICVPGITFPSSGQNVAAIDDKLNKITKILFNKIPPGNTNQELSNKLKEIEQYGSELKKEYSDYYRSYRSFLTIYNKAVKSTREVTAHGMSSQAMGALTSNISRPVPEAVSSARKCFEKMPKEVEKADEKVTKLLDDCAKLGVDTTNTNIFVLSELKELIDKYKKLKTNGVDEYITNAIQSFNAFGGPQNLSCYTDPDIE